MTPEQRSTVVEMLQVGMSNADISRALGISDRRVSEVRSKMGASELPGIEPGDIKGEREQYERGLRRAIPVKTRVNILRQLVRAKNPAVAIKALELADRLSGYAKGDDSLAQQTAPIFELPVGTKIKFTK